MQLASVPKLLTCSARTGRPPSHKAMAKHRGFTHDEVDAALVKLEEQLALALAPTTRNVWMAHPFSALPTPFSVESDNTTHWANCAWDVVAIPPLLGARRARRATLRRERRADAHGLSRGGARRGRRPHPLRGAASPFLGQCRLYVSHHPLLPVGRAHRPLVRTTTCGDGRDTTTRDRLAARPTLVSRSARRGLGAKDRGNHTLDFRDCWPHGRFLDSRMRGLSSKKVARGRKRLIPNNRDMARPVQLYYKAVCVYRRL